MSSKPEINASFKLFDDKKNEEIKFKPLFEIIESAKSIINELDTQSISPLEYFSNFISTTDHLTKIKTDIISYAESSLDMNYTLIYNIVYTMRLNRLCKVYLLSLIGNLICQKDISRIISILNEELFFLDEVEYPIVSFFAHYYCFTSFSESLKLCDMDIARQYYLNMIIEMNRLLNEMNKEGTSDNKDTQNLHCLVIENINKVILLEGVNENIFKTKIFPRLINLVFDKEEGDYSEYILDWIISGLNFSYVVQNFSIVVDTMLKVVEKDSSMSKKLNNIIEKIISNYKSSKPEIQELILSSIGSKIDKIFDTIINIMKKSKDIKSMEIKVYLEHIYSLITFTSVFINNNIDSNSFNLILGMIDEYFKDQEQEKANLESSKSKKDKEKDKNKTVSLITEDHIKIYEKIYLLLMKEKISLFSIRNIFSIIEHFDVENKQKANYNLLVYLNTSKDNLDEENKIEFLIPIIKNSIYIKTEEEPNTEHEEITIGKLIERINNPNPEKYLKLLVIFKNIFEKNKFKLEITVENFLTAILQLFTNVEENYHYILTKRENKDAEIENTAPVKMNLSEYTDEKLNFSLPAYQPFSIATVLMLSEYIYFSSSLKSISCTPKQLGLTSTSSSSTFLATHIPPGISSKKKPSFSSATATTTAPAAPSISDTLNPYFLINWPISFIPSRAVFARSRIKIGTSSACSPPVVSILLNAYTPSIDTATPHSLTPSFQDSVRQPVLYAAEECMYKKVVFT